MKKTSRIKHPELFQCKDEYKNYFEGWYFKHVDKLGRNVLSIIPGINIEDDKSSSFIQIIIGPQNESYYIDFDFDDFKCFDDPFSVHIGGNLFGLNGITLNIETENLQINGHIRYDDLTSLKNNIASPNIMGVFAYLKNMECNHGVISLFHTLYGEITYNETTINFDEGTGYIEKDWGTSFPKSYCWVQCNSFKDEQISLFLSVANIPFADKSFTGHICVLMIGSKQYRFATYNFSKIKKIDFLKDHLNIILRRGKYTLEVSCCVSSGAVLKAPKHGIMENNIKESVQGVVDFKLFDKDELICSSHGSSACVEVVNI